MSRTRTVGTVDEVIKAFWQGRELRTRVVSSSGNPWYTNRDYGFGMSGVRDRVEVKDGVG